jgi:uncharacterized protein YegP (UPF0339 family)
MGMDLKGKTLKSQNGQIIFNARDYFERNETKKGPLGVKEVTQRTADAK